MAPPSSIFARVVRRLEAEGRWKAWLSGVVGLLLALLAFKAFHGLWQEIDYNDVLTAMRAVSPLHMLLALLATLVSYVALTGYDQSAMRYVGARVPYRVVAQTSFVAYAVANTIGLGVFTGGAIRMRMYGEAGVRPGQITRAIAFNALAFGLGIAVVGAAGLLRDAPVLADMTHLPAWGLRAIGVAVLAATVALLFACRDNRQRRIFGRFVARLPPASLAMRQLVLSVVDISASAAVLWWMLPDGSIGFASFLGFYAAAVLLGVISHLPGGLGVFEAVMLVSLKGHVPAETLAGALVLYRIIYYLVPLMLALGLLVGHEVNSKRASSVTSRAISGLAPLLLSAYTLVVGVVLLVSGATPAAREAAPLLSTYVPLPLVEAAHFLSSITGLALLFVARAMLLRLDAARWAGMLLAVIGLLLALPKGGAVWEVVLTVSLFLALLVSRGQFVRRASLLEVPFSGGWLLAMGAICAALVVLVLFAYQDVDYAQQLWWQFEIDADAPRSLRAQVGVAILALALAVRHLLRTSDLRGALPTAAEIHQAATIVGEQAHADARLALTGDKYLLFAESRRAFVMYGRHGRSWIGLFDPVGPQSERAELVWQFIAAARNAGCRASFYQVRPDGLSLYLDAGLRLYKLGEYAHVRLADFSLQGKRSSNLRQSMNRAEREGLRFEIVPPEGVPGVLEELRAVSNDWLARHRTAEKRFSVGAFIDDYILCQPVALVRRDDRVVAFATLLTTGLRDEASVDLMRHQHDIPNGTMDFLFAQLILHFREAGYARFGLGMAPLSGMADNPLAPYWHRVGRILFANGENFYNFRGLRAFKEKFDPVWEARYLAAPGGLVPIRTLLDIAALISGGYRGVLLK